ncbi:hypothetical protein WDW86_13080 [Bdellovibrionota bacterium FG-2]
MANIPTQPFKVCPNCKKNWGSRDVLIEDPAIELIGYQMAKDSVEKGLFLFNHNAENCCTTLSCKVAGFTDLYEGKLFTEDLFGTATCEKHCLNRNDLSECNQPCSNHFVRTILQVILKKNENQKKR